MISTILYKPSPKMKKVWKESANAKFRLLEGAVRSSKSFLTNDIALREIQQLPACDVLISGYSITSVARNIIAEWKKIINPVGRDLFQNVKADKEDFLRIHWRGLRNKKFYVRGSGKEGDFKQIQGATFGYWLGDELTRHTESFTDMAMTRLSPPFSKAIWTTNSDSPFHYVKKRFIDNPALYVEDENGYSLYKRWSFELRDNPSLTKDYIESLKRMYTGVFYKRYVLGLWVLAEGSIYDFFEDKAPYVIDSPPAKALHYFVGCDYGTGNPTCFILFGYNPHSTPKIWAEREYYYSSRDMGGQQKTDAEYSIDLRKWLNGITPSKIIIDPSAASFRLQLERDGFFGVVEADNSVVDGIRTQARMLKSGQYAICRCCEMTREEYNGYIWDEKAQLVGIDRPVKQRDHSKDAERYVLQTEFGQDTLDLDMLTKW